MAWVRRVRTSLRATVVQIAEYSGGKRRIVAHVGSAHSEAELGVLMARAWAMLGRAGQGELDLGLGKVERKHRLVAATADPVLFSRATAEAPVKVVAPGRVLGTAGS